MDKGNSAESTGQNSPVSARTRVAAWAKAWAKWLRIWELLSSNGHRPSSRFFSVFLLQCCAHHDDGDSLGMNDDKASRYEKHGQCDLKMRCKIWIRFRIRGIVFLFADPKRQILGSILRQDWLFFFCLRPSWRGSSAQQKKMFEQIDDRQRFQTNRCVTNLKMVLSEEKPLICQVSKLSRIREDHIVDKDGAQNANVPLATDPHLAFISAVSQP